MEEEDVEAFLYFLLTSDAGEIGALHRRVGNLGIELLFLGLQLSGLGVKRKDEVVDALHNHLTLVVDAALEVGNQRAVYRHVTEETVAEQNVLIVLSNELFDAGGVYAGVGGKEFELFTFVGNHLTHILRHIKLVVKVEETVTGSIGLRHIA